MRKEDSRLGRLNDQVEEVQSSGDKKTDDQTLAAKARDGNLEAFEVLFKRYYMPIFRLGYQLCSNQQDAEEVAQLTFSKAARAISTFRGDSAFKSWLWRIAINNAHDLRRKRRSRQNYEEPVEDIGQRAEDAAATSSAGVPGAPDPEALQDDQQKMILEALNALPEKQREVMVLTVYEELSHAEVAKVLKISINTVSWRAHAAKKKLKTIIEKRMKQKDQE